MTHREKWTLNEIGNNLKEWSQDDSVSDSLELMKGDRISTLVKGIGTTLDLDIPHKIELDECLKKIVFLCHECK